MHHGIKAMNDGEEWYRLELLGDPVTDVKIFKYSALVEESHSQGYNNKSHIHYWQTQMHYCKIHTYWHYWLAQPKHNKLTLLLQHVGQCLRDQWPATWRGDLRTLSTTTTTLPPLPPRHLPQQSPTVCNRLKCPRGNSTLARIVAVRCPVSAQARDEAQKNPKYLYMHGCMRLVHKHPFDRK